MNILLELNFKQIKATRLFTCIFGLFAFCFVKESTTATLLLAAVMAIMFKNPTAVYVMSKTLPRDVIACYRFLKVSGFIAYIEYRGWSIARRFQQMARKHPLKPCLQIDERVFTFQCLEVFSNKVGSYFQNKNLQQGDCVALLMETRPEYVGIWLGLSKLGVVTALINNHQKRETLVHSLKVANVKAIIVGTELIGALKEIMSYEELAKLPIYQFSDEAQRTSADFELLKDAIDLTSELKTQKILDLKDSIAKCGPRDKLLYVYTSGTTGLPKAAVITNSRFLFMCTGTYYMLALHSNDIIYNTLPLYHTAGGIVCIGNALVQGCTVVLRKKFSASNFWKDCIKYNCSAAQYIGELCRYLLATPNKPEDTQHKLRMIYGNGLRPQIWSQFVSRFNIPFVGEVYGSTEGNSNLANITNQVGAIGFLPFSFLSRLFPVHVIKVDEETGQPIRNKKGFCMRCKPGETGLLIGKVIARRAALAFSGYADKEATEKKLLRNVFTKGDVYFNSGDMLVGDILSYYYFKDRTGDTFRWRGENVATQEVEAIITSVIGLQDCVVYGVDIPYVEGKAGMAAIVDPQRKVDMEHLSAGIRGSLPVYAQPLFVRLMKEIPQTATFKMKKRELMTESFDINKISDPIYYLNKDGIYRALTAEQYEQIQNGKAGL